MSKNLFLGATHIFFINNQLLVDIFLSTSFYLIKETAHYLFPFNERYVCCFIEMSAYLFLVVK
jgi:hypothetical protein